MWLGARTRLYEAARHLIVEEPADALSPQLVGAALFQALFAGQIGILFAHSRGIAGARGQGLRLRLRFRPDKDPRLLFLHSLPWELLYQPETRDFLGLSRLTPIVRSLDVPRPPRPLPPFPLASPLRILGVVATTPGSAALNLEREQRFIREAWAGSGTEVVFLEQPDLATLRETLVAAPFHVLHFMGHGEVDPAKDAGVLFFAGQNGERLPVTGESLATVLKDVPSLRLVFLNACETGQTPDGPEVDPFASVAAALVLGGVPAVVAMQLPVEDEAAIIFSRTVYRRLAAGDPVDAAVVEGRQAIHAFRPDTAEWAIPVLFTRIPDGRIFVPQTDAPASRERRAWRPPVLRFPRLAQRRLAAAVLVVTILVLALLAVRRWSHPAPPERVWLGRFWISRYEVSNDEFLRFVMANPEWRRDRIRPGVHDDDYLRHWIAPLELPEGLADHPVTRVSWFAAQAYCRWQGGRLPSREEWQTAAHSAEGPYPWGKTDPAGPAPLNFCDAACLRQHRDATDLPHFRDDYPETAPVSSFPNGRTREGVYNLSGNVWEWCFTPSGDDRVTMGGSYLMTFQECSTDTQGAEDAKLCAPDVGFRCAWD